MTQEKSGIFADPVAAVKRYQQAVRDKLNKNCLVCHKPMRVGVPRYSNYPPQTVFFHGKNTGPYAGRGGCRIRRNRKNRTGVQYAA